MMVALPSLFTRPHFLKREKSGLLNNQLYLRVNSQAPEQNLYSLSVTMVN